MESDSSDDSPKKSSPMPKGNSTWKSDSIASKSNRKGSKDNSKDDSKTPVVIT